VAHDSLCILTSIAFAHSHPANIAILTFGEAWNVYSQGLFRRCLSLMEQGIG